MSDIAMCPGYIDDFDTLEKTWCPMRNECYRFTAAPEPVRQSYMLPRSIGVDCAYYWPVKPEPNRKEST